MEPCLCALSESHTLALAIARHAGLEVTPIEERRFEGGEFKLRPLASVRGRTVYVVQSLAAGGEYPAAERLVRLLFLLGVLKDAGARERVAVIPYIAYARKERRTQVRDPVNTRYVAQLLESMGLDRGMTLDVHNPASFDNAFRVPVDHLSALPLFADHFATRLGDAPLAVVSPDVGGVKRAQLFREFLARRTGRDVELAFIEKRRARDVVASGLLVGGGGAREVVIVDDLCATGGTLVRAAAICRGAGVRAVHVAVTHAPLAAGLDVLRAAADIDSVAITDSVAPGESAAPAGKIHTVSVAPLLGQALRRIGAGRPVAPLLERWPVDFGDDS